jgi:hypothetical protein
VFPTLAPDAADVTNRFNSYPVYNTPLEQRRWDELFGSLLS